jgi:hypothetical protein
MSIPTNPLDRLWWTSARIAAAKAWWAYLQPRPRRTRFAQQDKVAHPGGSDCHQARQCVGQSTSSTVQGGANWAHE